MNYHYLAQYIASTQHKIVIAVVGCGGTGSHVITNLAAMNKAFIGLGRQPIHVIAYDGDVIEEHNVGRQMFSPADIGENKATVLIERINRFFGFEWSAMQTRFEQGMDRKFVANINVLISCVDTAKSRRGIAKYIKGNVDDGNEQRRLYYWLDTGNSMHTGQIILGTVGKIKQPGKSKLNILPCWTDEYKGIRDRKSEPSCSLAESLGRQDLFINKIIATYATDMLWQLMKNYRIHYRGLYINLESMQTKPILL